MLLKKGLDMTTKSVFLYILLLTLTRLSFAQIVEKRDSTLFFDADSTCIGVFYKTNDKVDSTIYWDLKKNKIRVVFDVPQYEFGIDSLNNLLLDKFRTQLNFVEVNGAALVYILLQDNKIKEIRIGKRIGYDPKYDELIIKTLMITQNNWIIPKKIDKPILFVYLFKMK